MTEPLFEIAFQIPLELWENTAEAQEKLKKIFSGDLPDPEKLYASEHFQKELLIAQTDDATLAKKLFLSNINTFALEKKLAEPEIWGTYINLLVAVQNKNVETAMPQIQDFLKGLLANGILFHSFTFFVKGDSISEMAI